MISDIANSSELAMTDELMELSIQAWKNLLKGLQAKYTFSPIERRIDLSHSELTLGTDDFAILMHAFAESIGIDLQEYGRRLAGPLEQERLIKYQVAIAFRTVFEVEGYYVDVPSAYTLSKVPTKFLIVMGAVVIGIATAKAAQLNAILAGAMGGAASLLINILSERYVRAGKESDLSWIEEFVLKFLKSGAAVSINELYKQTKLNRSTLRKTLDRLIEKQLVVRKTVKKGKKWTIQYSLK